MSTRTILALGATGNQGGALVRALAKINEASAGPTLRYKILAHTRDASSATAKSLSSLKGVELVEGSYEALPSIFERHKPIYGVFNVQPPRFENEAAESCKVVDMSVAIGVQHMVYSSVDFGGQEDTGLEFWETKRQVENYIKTQPIKWTFLRPTTFMTNFARYDTDPQSMIMLTSFLHFMFPPNAPKTLRCKYIAPSDIAHFAALAFEHPDEYIGKAIALAGDDLNTEEVLQAFHDAGLDPEHGTPEPMVAAQSFLDNSETYRKMMAWLGGPGPNGTGPYSADVPAVRKVHPGLQTLKQFLETEVVSSKRQA